MPLPPFTGHRKATYPIDVVFLWRSVSMIQQGLYRCGHRNASDPVPIGLESIFCESVSSVFSGFSVFCDSVTFAGLLIGKNAVACRLRKPLCCMRQHAAYWLAAADLVAWGWDIYVGLSYTNHK